MQGKVEQAGEVKLNKQSKPYFTLKIGGVWYSVPGDESEKDKVVDKMISYTVTKASTGNFNAWIKVDAVADTPASAPTSESSNSHISWADYASMAKLAHDLALEFEPDGTRFMEAGGESGNQGFTTVDRSHARAAILNTIMIAYTQGKIFNPTQDDDQIPF